MEKRGWCDCEAGCCRELPRHLSLPFRLQETFAQPVTLRLTVGERSDVKVNGLAEDLESRSILVPP